MLGSFYKLIFIFTINLIVSIPIYAKPLKQNQLAFPIKTENLLKGEIHYYSEMLSPGKLVVKHPITFDLDSLSLIQESNVEMVVTKAVYMVNKPVGFFDEQQMNDEKFVAHIMGDQKVKKLSENAYSITNPDDPGFIYKMQSFFDADDISTLPNSKIIRAVTAAKKLDVISQGASTIMFTEKTHFSKYTEGGVTVSSFIPIKEDKTLIISYNLWAVKKAQAIEYRLEENFLKEIIAVKKLIENFKP